MLSNIKSIVFVIILFCMIQNVYAVEIESKSIYPNSYSVQVGAFKNMSNIQRVKENLFKYEIYLESYKGMYRIRVVNILSSALKETLFEIRKSYPKSFIVKRPISKNTQPHSVKPSGKLYEQYQPYELNLDSNTILKTRKSFL